MSVKKDKKFLFDNLENLGIERNDTLLIHSSFKSLGKVSLKPYDLLNGFIEYVDKGILIFLGLSHKLVNKENPCFDIRKTRFCVGYLPELFRLDFKVERSMHPTHSVFAVGKEAKSITKSHGLENTPCGENSPFSLLPQYNGKILMLGCGLKPITSMHAIEELFEPEYLFGDTVDFTLVNNEEEVCNKQYKTHNFDGLAQRYDKIIKSNSDHWIKKGNIFNADCFLMDSNKLWIEAKSILEKDNNYFVEKIETKPELT